MKYVPRPRLLGIGCQLQGYTVGPILQKFPSHAISRYLPNYPRLMERETPEMVKALALVMRIAASAADGHWGYEQVSMKCKALLNLRAEAAICLFYVYDKWQCSH